MPLPDKYLPAPAETKYPRIPLPVDVAEALDRVAWGWHLSMASFCRVALTLVSRGEPVTEDNVLAEAAHIRAQAREEKKEGA